MRRFVILTLILSLLLSLFTTSSSETSVRCEEDCPCESQSQPPSLHTSSYQEPDPCDKGCVSLCPPHCGACSCNALAALPLLLKVPFAVTTQLVPPVMHFVSLKLGEPLQIFHPPKTLA